MNPENYDLPTFEEVIREKEDTITALRAEVEEWRRLYERAEASIQYGYAPEADQLRSQLSARRRRRAGLERGEEVPAAHQGE